MTKSLPAWDLSSLYSGIADREVDKTISATDRALNLFASRYRKKAKMLARKPLAMLQAFQEYEHLLSETSKPLIYAQLLFADSCSDPRRGAFLQKLKSWRSRVEKQLVFFELELLDLDVSLLKKLAGSQSMAAYSNYLTQLLATKPHRLNEREEQIISDKSLVGREAFTRLFDEELSRKVFTMKKGGRAKTYSESEVLAMLYNPASSARKAAAEALTKGLKEEAPRLAFIFNTLIEDKSLEDELRSFPYPEASRHLANQIDKSMVQAMESVVVGRYKLVQDFYTFKRKLVKAPALFDYDRYAPVVKSEGQITFNNARDMVLDSFHAFSEDFGRIAKEFFDRGWIDAARRPGKRGGAFCSFGTPDTNPFVFLNFNGNVRDVFTLAHELGHAIHAYLMRGQNYLNYDTPLTVAETASVFAEMLLFDHLASTLKSRKDLLSLYVNKVEGIIATVFRQISLFRFEQELHRQRKESGELLVPEINAIWRKSQMEMFAKSVVLTENYDYWWSYIPHFIHTPFYVYAYAYGELLTLSLYAQYRAEGDKFVQRYIQFLSKGASESPAELLKPFGINMKDRRFWTGGVNLIEELARKARSYA